MNHETECGCGQHGQRETPGMGYGHGERWGHHGYPGGGGMHLGGGCCCYYDCGCHHGGRMHHGHGLGGFEQRRFPTREEIIEGLEEYLKQLKAEAKGVEERLAELKKEG